jgi:RimJ/RimL family protein N-acetyltransferase
VPRPDVVVETERCRVRDWRDEDADRVFDLYSRWEVARWLGAAPRVLAEPKEGLDLVRRWRAANADDPATGRWAVERREDGVVAGTVVWLPLPNGDGELEVGWHLHPDSWGRGLATEAARAVVERGFAGGVPEVFAVTRPDNTRSQAVCLRLGMEPLGRTEKWYGVPLDLYRLTAPRAG